MKASATVKKNARSWVVARATAHKNLRWRMASGRRPNNSNFNHGRPANLGFCGDIGDCEVAAEKNDTSFRTHHGRDHSPYMVVTVNEHQFGYEMTGLGLSGLMASSVMALSRTDFSSWPSV